MRPGSGLAAAATLVVLAGCADGGGGPPDADRFGAPVVPLAATATVEPHVVGGTPGMRARARAILAGMGGVAIAEVRFGRPPAAFTQLRHVTGPVWVSTTVVTGGSPFAGPLRTQLAADARMWQGLVFARAYQASQPPGEPRVRGASELLSFNGRVHRFSSELGPAAAYGGGPESDAAVRAAIAEATGRARFIPVSVVVAHANRQAVTVVVRTLRRTAFARRYRGFVRELRSLRGHLDGLQWQVVDRCGYPVTIVSASAWTSARWLCPDPDVPGLLTTRAACRRQASELPSCG